MQVYLGEPLSYSKPFCGESGSRGVILEVYLGVRGKVHMPD